jgi:transcriptional regulator with XRE-family HTH domain
MFSKTLKKLRAESGISQLQLAERLFVERSTISRWESGNRIPDNRMIARISKLLDADINILLNAAAESDEFPNVIIVDDTKIILKGGIPVLEAVMPNAMITGFTRPSEAVEYAKTNRVALAFLDCIVKLKTK